MNEISAKFKRQIEILGIAIRNTQSLGTEDLAEMYGVERLTIKRDLQELRTAGFNVHSEGKRGVRLSGNIDSARLHLIMTSYLALSSMASSIDKASKLLTNKLGMEALNIAVALQRCVENTEKVQLSYESERQGGAVNYIIEPIQIFQADTMWRLLAVHDGVLKQFILTKAVSVVPINRPFVRPSKECVQALFQNSFSSWIGGEQYSVLLRLPRASAPQLLKGQLISFKVVGAGDDENLDVAGTVNSLDEIARWIVGQGGIVQALSPPSLKDKIKSLAVGVLGTHGTQKAK